MDPVLLQQLLVPGAAVQRVPETQELPGGGENEQDDAIKDNTNEEERKTQEESNGNKKYIYIYKIIYI